jgi:glycerol-3-phosphate dehydrogenase
MKLQSREHSLQALTEGTLDLLIIGGGIVGAGIARDAALRGLKVGLVEQNDFASGTSSRSSRLLHGGLRYLAQGRIGLVHEASVEKTVIHHIAPHLAEPLPFIFPTYRGNRNWVLWQLKIGVKIYDLLCRGRNLGKSTWLDPARTLEKIPGLKAMDLNGAVRYFDGFTNDARLVLDTLRSADMHHAWIINRCRFNRSRRSDVWECELEDQLTQGLLSVRARAVVNATGPWADGLPRSRVKLRLTKGIHLVIERARLPVTETVVMTEGSRILFAIPWGERTILGTTDTDYDDWPERVRTHAADIEYVLRIANQFFPGAKLFATDVINAWAGLRPLLAGPKGNASDISRSHEITNPEPGWWDVAGGKLTTHRLMAEQAVTRIVKSLKLKTPACRTAIEPLLPANEVNGFSGILPPEFSRQAVEHYVGHEWALSLDDVMIRRTSWHYYSKDAATKARQVADWMSELLGWTDEKRAEELRQYLALVHPQPALDAPPARQREESPIITAA